MVSTSWENLVYDVRLSSAVPARITGEDKVHELTNKDMIMKLHYLKGIYFFSSEAAQGLSIHDLKNPIFECLALYYPISGRVRKSEDDGRPFIKCNDSGVRIIEAKCSKSVNEWLEMKDDSSLDDHLIYSQFLGPDSGFTPLVFIQFTWFKCGGISVGLSWAHILGDAFSASHFINMWGKILKGQVTIHEQLEMPSTKNNPLSQVAKVPFSLQKVLLDPAGDQWLVNNHSKMQYHSFHFTAKQLNHLMQAAKSVKPFEVISALMWKSLAKIRSKLLSEPKIVTICSRNTGSCDNENEFPNNSQINISTIEVANVKSAVAEADLAELCKLIAQNQVDETNLIEDVMHHDDEKDNDGKSCDFILYGAHLTFVNLEGVKIYGLELGGQKPIFARYSLYGVGDEGAILVLPGPPASGKEEGGRVINLVLPGNQIEELKYELRKEWGFF